MVNHIYIPKRGDIVWLDFNPQTGHEQSGRRPALILSPFNYNKKTHLALVCPITTQIKSYPFEVLLPIDLSVKGAILSDQIKSLDWRERNATFICELPQNLLNDVTDKVIALIGVK